MLATLLPARTGAADPTLAEKATAILSVHCGRCHGLDGPGKGGMNFIQDRERLVVRNKLVPGKPAQSPIYQRIQDGEMPPAGAKQRPGPDELAVLKQWIEAGAPAAGPATAPRPFVTEADLVYLILADLKTVEPRHRRFMRYFTFANLTNAGVSETSLQAYRHALSKLVNSLSWHPRITQPRTVEPGRAIVRVDLRDLQWTPALWNRLLSFYPYPIPQKTADFKAIATATASELPYVRADWFVATASRPPLYHDLLQIPVTDRDLERQLRVEALVDIQEDRVVRSGFNGSGVARNNRLLERHDAAYGAYWRSYDFAENTERQNLFDHPLGPQAGGNSFEHSGGEIIFNLPNGLQGYMLVDANGRRLDRAPVEIVSDPKRPDRVVETAISCFSCHYQGVIHKADQIRAHVEKNPNVFANNDADAVKGLYPPEVRFKALLEGDMDRFLKAVAKTGAPLGEPEPVVTLALRYEGEVDLPAAAAEAGLRPGEFLKRLNASPALGRILGALKVPGGTVQRQVFQGAFLDMVRELRLGDEVRPSSPNGVLSASPALRPFEGHTGYILSIAFSPDGQRALSGAEDNTVRLWEVASGREIRPLEGHTGEVLTVAFSPDGKRALSGSMDRTLRLWDLTSGRELRRFEGHTERVSTVAFSPDGKQALSGSWDQTVSLWDVDSGKELRRMGGHTSYVSTVAFAPDRRRALSGGYDRTLRLWDLATGKEIRRFDGSLKEVYSVAFSSDRRWVLSGGNDHLVRLWDAHTGKEVRQFAGHAKAVIRVAFSADGNRVLSASSQYQGADKTIRLWDRKSGREIGSFGGSADTVWSLAFAADGRRALSGSADKTLRLWELSK
jgi:hypothetical protein